ncbi:hypothetical protein IP88_08820 [alpha proteobacterium AAP81b]|nr:hypothetical protein IP88_08820 [alpha proteobacterium AAP81b]
MARVRATPRALPFDAERLAFIAGFGEALRRLRDYPELVALGFWARPANLKRLAERLAIAHPAAMRLPRGLAFHVAPANVDTIFVYSLLLSMLAGNNNIVRISARGGDQTGSLLQVLATALAGAPPAVRDGLLVVRYDHDAGVTRALSALADLRIVWGGDATVGLIREAPLAPAATELVFPNKYSLAVLDAGHWLAADAATRARLAKAFVNDSLWFGQAACSSPRALVWRGDDATVDAASPDFWAAVDAAAATAGIDFDGAYAVAKLIAEQGLAIAGGATILATPSNRIRVVRRPDLAGLGEPAAAAHGFFLEHRVDSLAALAPAARRHWQTIVSEGVPAADWRDFLWRSRPHGIDRIMGFGAALDFDAVWDGTDLLAAMTRLTAIGIS